MRMTVSNSIILNTSHVKNVKHALSKLIFEKRFVISSNTDLQVRRSEVSEAALRIGIDLCVRFYQVVVAILSLKRRMFPVLLWRHCGYNTNVTSSEKTCLIGEQKLYTLVRRRALWAVPDQGLRYVFLMSIFSKQFCRSLCSLCYKYDHNRMNTVDLGWHFSSSIRLVLRRWRQKFSWIVNYLIFRNQAFFTHVQMMKHFLDVL